MTLGGRVRILGSIGLLALGFTGCEAGPTFADAEGTSAGAEGTSAAPVPLLDHAAWTLATGSEDPLQGHASPLTECPAGAYGVEGAALEVETGYCQYLSLQQPLPVAIEAGQALRLSLWHADLVFDPPAEGHVAVLIDGTAWWEAHVAIPASASIYDEQFTAPVDVAAGTPVVFHLHNHGYNTWSLLSLDVMDIRGTDNADPPGSLESS